MCETQFFGPDPSVFHITNLLLHAASAVLLFAVLHDITGTLGRSAIVAALFAVHPLHVESVAWISDRKDVLGLLFWLLAIWAYVQFVKNIAKQRAKAKIDYVFALGFFACSLMCKGTFAILPMILLLLDWWPLRRVSVSLLPMQQSEQGYIHLNNGYSRIGCLLWEKVPFCIFAFAFVVAGLYGQKEIGALRTSAEVPWLLRGINAVSANAHYLVQTVWPTHLTAYYPFPKTFSELWTMAGFTLLLGISAAALWNRERLSYLAFGWLWYLITLLPAMGLVQIGSHARADRYTYLPLIGIFIAFSWGSFDLYRRWHLSRRFAVAVVALLMSASAVVARHQLAYWSNSEVFFRHMLDVTQNNSLAHYNLGLLLRREGKLDEAIEHYRAAIQLSPDYVDALNNLGNALALKGQTAEATEYYRRALQIRPDSLDALNNLAAALSLTGHGDEAIQVYKRFVQLKPNDPEAHFKLGHLLVGLGHRDEAQAQFEEALRLKPDYPEVRAQLRQLGSSGSE
jgi:tetratricopeptide (TPR) repeat protein